MKSLRYLPIFLIVILSSQITYGQQDSTFWFAVPYATDEHDPPLMGDLTITAVDKTNPTEITITQPHNPQFGPINRIIDPTVNPTLNIDFTENELRKFSNANYNVYENNALLIKTEGREISAYFEFHRDRNNPDIFSLKGSNALGNEFWVPFQQTWPNQTAYDSAFSQICIVATENKTTINLDFQSPTEGYGNNATITLDKGETFMFVPEHDSDGFPGQDPGDRLAGTHIQSDKPIAVTTGDDSVVKGSAYDYIGDQLVPVENSQPSPPGPQKTIGKEYIVMKGQVSDNSGNEKVYVLATHDNTTLSIKRKEKLSYSSTIDAGKQEVIDLIHGDEDHYVHIEANNPVYVFHVSGKGHELGGAIVPALDGCTGSMSVSFRRSRTDPFYLNIMTRKKALDQFYISVNNGPAQKFLGASDFEEVGPTGFYVLKDASKKFPNSSIPSGIPVNSNIRIFNGKGCSEPGEVFHLGIINGKDSGGGCRYGYFSDFKDERGSALILESGEELLSRCAGDPIELKASGGNCYHWRPAKYLENPDTSHTVGNFPPGTYHDSVTISRPCYGDTVIHVYFEIFPNVDASFDISNSATGCAPHQIEIVNNSDNASTYKWDYQNDRSYDSNISDHIHYHTYQNTTNSDSVYTLKLFAESKDGCVDIDTAKITVLPEINANFNRSPDEGCNPLNVSFNNTSSGNTDKYEWFFGDGNSSSQTSPDHEFLHHSISDSTYNVKMVATSPYYCRDTAYEDVTVYSYFKPGFTINKVKGCSPFDLEITHDSDGDIDTAFWTFTGSQGWTIHDTTYNNITAPDITLTNNNTNKIDTVNILLNVSNGNCNKIQRDTVYVYPEVTADFLQGNISDCNPFTETFDNQSKYTGMTTGHPEDTLGLVYDWDFGDGGTSEKYRPTHQFSNSGPTDVSYTVTLTTTTPQGCFDTAQAVMTVSPYIKADFKVEETSGCSPFEVEFENTMEGGVDGVFWDFNEDGKTDSTIMDTRFTRTFYHTGTSPKTITIRQIVENEDGCRDTVYRDVTIKPSVNASFTPTETLGCNPLDVTFNNHSVYHNTGSNSNLNYDWDFGNGSSSASFEPDQQFENTTNSVVDFPVELVVSSPSGCQDSVTDTISVYPYVEPDFTLERADSCSPFNLRVNNHSSGGMYEWYWDDSNLAVSPDSTGLANGFTKKFINRTGVDSTIQLTLIAGTDTGGGTIGCTQTLKREVTIYPEVTAAFQPLDTIDCNVFELDFKGKNNSHYTNTNDNSDLSYNWAFGDGISSKEFEPDHAYGNTTSSVKTYSTELTVSSPHNCTDAISHPVRVEPYINANFEIDKNKGCAPLEINITNNSVGGITQYYWYWDDDNLSGPADANTSGSSFSHTYTNTSGSLQVRYLTLIVTNGNCYDTLKRQIRVYPSIDAQFTETITEGCSPLTVNFFEGNSSDPEAKTYSWDFGDGATSNEPIIENTFENPSTSDTTFRVRYIPTTQYGCTDTAWQDIHVYSSLRADFEIEEDEGCPPYPVTFENTSVGNPGDTYEWTVTNLNTMNTVATVVRNDKSPYNYEFENEDPSVKKFEVELLAANNDGCESVYRDTITVYPDVDADFAMDRTEGCNPLDVDFTETASVPNNTTYSWDFGDGATSAEEDPKHTFFNYDRVQDKWFTINLEVISPYGCRHDTSRRVQVYHQPKAKFDIDTTSSCPPLEATMEDQSTGHDRWEWRFGDGEIDSSSAQVTHPYPNITNNVKTYDLELFVETNRGCSDSTGLKLSVYPEVMARFDPEQPEDCAPLVTGFENNSRNADYYNWDFGDGVTSSQDEPLHKFTNTTGQDTTYEVKLVSSSAFECIDSVTKTVTVNAQPNAEFTIQEGFDLQKWPESEVVFDNESNSGPWDYTWSFDDGQQSHEREPGSHDYDHWGEYTIGLDIVSNTSTCSDNISKDIEILPPEIHADFSMRNFKGCEPLEVEFNGQESPFNESYQYEWDFGDGTTGRGRLVSHQYDSAGTYYVKMTARAEGGTEIAYDTVVVYKRPEVEFEVDPTLVMLPDQKMHCYNFTDYARTYSWDFGDGSGNSTKEAPLHQYKELGTYTVTLTAWSEEHTCADGNTLVTCRCRDRDSLSNVVEVRGKGHIEFPNAFTPSPSGPSNGYWDPEATDNDIFHPVGEGIKNYTLEIYNKWGERLFISHKFEVGWDGYYKGRLLPQDVYIWKAEGEFYNGKSFEKMGDVTLLRNFPNGDGGD